MKIAILQMLAASLLVGMPASAQIATDGSMGARTSFTGNNVRIPSAVGTAAGRNLFHSFSTFNVSTGQIVTFEGTAGAFDLTGFLNIIGRVTGGAPSTILGTIRSSNPGTSLYLINPNGIVFGAGAVVDVNGSFHASSAHYLRFADGTAFESRLGSDVKLSFSAPSGFGFGAGNIAPIAAQGGTLRVRDGATISLVGGNLLVGGAATGISRLQASGGQVILVSVASPGEVSIGQEEPVLTGFTSLGNVSLQRGAVVTVSEGAGRSGAGTIFIRGRDVSLDQAFLFANTAFAHGGGIDIAATGDITLLGSEVTAVTTGAGNAGSIRLAGRNLLVLTGTLVDTSCDPGCTSGNGGLIDVRVTDSFIIRNATEGTAATAYVVSNSFGGGRTGEIHVEAGRLVIDGNAALQGIAFSTGDATRIRLRTGTIELLNGGQVDTSTGGSGRGGAIVVENAGAIRIEGTRTEKGRPLPVPSGFVSNANASGKAGSVTISTRSLEVLGGGEISSAAFSTGAGGSIAIDARESIRIAGADANGYESGIATNTFSTGSAGEIRLAAPSIEISDQGKVQSVSEGDGRAGRIRIEGGDLAINSRGRVSSDAFARGDAGAIEIALTGTLSITGVAGARLDETGIFAKSFGVAGGGSVVIDAARVVLDKRGGVFATTQGSGDAGRISVHAKDSISMANGSRIASETIGSGAAGSIEVSTEGTVSMTGNSRISTSTAGSGNAGSIDIHAVRGIALSQGSNIISESGSTGNAGNVLVATEGLLDLRDGARITTAALSADGGNIAVFAGSAFMDASLIATEVGSGQGAGGNMEIHASTLVMRNSAISANAFGGPGGNIHLVTRTFIPSADSSVTASSQLGIDGTVTLDSPAIDPTGQLLLPKIVFFDAGSVLAGRCGPRLAGRASSLLVEPRRLADVAPDALRNMLEILAPESASTCQPAAAARS